MTAKGFVFLSLEDESGMVNVVVSPQLAAAQRTELTQHPMLMVEIWNPVRPSVRYCIPQPYRVARVPPSTSPGA